MDVQRCRARLHVWTTSPEQCYGIGYSLIADASAPSFGWAVLCSAAAAAAALPGWLVPALLSQLGKAVDEMTVILDMRGTSSTSAMSHTLTRHREILTDYTRDARRTTAQIREAEKRSNLLGSVRAEISSFKQRQEGQSDTDMLLGERNRIDESKRMTDQVLEQAYATRYEFAQQRGMLGGVNSRMKGVICGFAQRLPCEHAPLHAVGLASANSLLTTTNEYIFALQPKCQGSTRSCP